MSGITKSMLIERIAIRYPALPPRDVELAVKAIFDRISRQLVEGVESNCVDSDRFLCTKEEHALEEIRKQVNLWCWIQKQFPTSSQARNFEKRLTGRFWILLNHETSKATGHLGLGRNPFSGRLRPVPCQH